jgi:Starch-binding associating with outer membrane/Susd and RagB outer membrane lipoprotein
MRALLSGLCGLCLFATVFFSCGKQFDKLLDNPSLARPSSADVDLYLNNAQIGFANFLSVYDAVGNINGAFDFGAWLMRMEAATTGSTYPDLWSGENFDIVWRNGYTQVFKDLNAMFPLAEQQKKYTHLAIGKILKAYTAITLVDLFGDVPYTEAVQGNDNTNPAADPGRAVYDSAISLLNSAIADLKKTSSAAPLNDLFYKGSKTKWTTLAKTILLKVYIQTRLVDNTAKAKIQALLNENDLIDTEDEDFQFQFGSKDQAPDSRHPKYINNYGTDQGAADYIGNHFMWMMVTEKGIVDPRIRYYLYRQTTDITAAVPDPAAFQFTIPCYFRSRPAHYPPSMTFCLVTNGYIGRDHLNNEGIPPDNQLRTTFGVYPAGGQFDNSQSTHVGPGIGGKGAGILPIWISAFTEFVKSEAVLTLTTTGDARASLESGIRKSFSKVFAFPAKLGVTVPANRVPSQTTQDNYVNNVLTSYDNAASVGDKLNVVMKEWYLASWGNGLEPYNFYRRTGKPDNLQLAVNTPNPGSFYRSLYYPAVFANLNNKATQKASTGVKVFWDTNPDNFIK